MFIYHVKIIVVGWDVYLPCEDYFIVIALVVFCNDRF